VYLDDIVLKRSWAGEVRNVSLVAIGVNGEGYRQSREVGGAAADQGRRTRGHTGRGNADLLRLSGGRLPAYPHQQSARAHPVRDQAADARGRRLPGWAIGPLPRRGQAAPHRWHSVVDQTIPQHRTAEGPTDERSHHRLSQ
jgi:hypothetical protein